MLADAETLAVRTRRVESGETGRLTLGFISTVDYSILPGLLSAYRAAHPGVTLELRELTSDVQLRELHEGRIDAGMLLAPVDDTALAMLPLLREPLVAALPADDPLARSRAALSLASLAGRPFVIFPAFRRSRAVRRDHRILPARAASRRASRRKRSRCRRSSVSSPPAWASPWCRRRCATCVAAASSTAGCERTRRC